MPIFISSGIAASEDTFCRGRYRHQVNTNQDPKLNHSSFVDEVSDYFFNQAVLRTKTKQVINLNSAKRRFPNAQESLLPKTHLVEADIDTKSIRTKKAPARGMSMAELPTIFTAATYRALKAQREPDAWFYSRKGQRQVLFACSCHSFRADKKSV